MDNAKPVTHFTIGRFVKPIGKGRSISLDSNGSCLTVKLHPVQHWEVTGYDTNLDTVSLTYKHTILTLPAAHAAQLFTDYDQTPEGKALYKVWRP